MGNTCIGFWIKVPIEQHRFDSLMPLQIFLTKPKGDMKDNYEDFNWRREESSKHSDVIVAVAVQFIVVLI